MGRATLAFSLGFDALVDGTFWKASGGGIMFGLSFCQWRLWKEHDGVLLYPSF